MTPEVIPPRRQAEPDPDPQLLLPEPFRADWAVLPRGMAYWLVAMGALLGAGFALTIAGLALGPLWLKLSFPVALLVARVGAWLLRGYEDRGLHEVGRYLSGPDAPGGTAASPAMK